MGYRGGSLDRDAYAYMSGNHKDVVVVHEKVVVPVVPGRFTRADAEAGYRYYRG